MPTAIVPGIYDPSLADENIWIETEDAYAMCRRLAREEAVLAGISSGANLVAACKIARGLAEAGKRGVIVTVLCDGAYKYLSESFWTDRLGMLRVEKAAWDAMVSHAEKTFPKSVAA